MSAASLLELISKQLASTLRSSKDQVRQEAYGIEIPRKITLNEVVIDIYPSRLYDERAPPEPTYPLIRPSEADVRHGEEQKQNNGHDRQLHFNTGEDIEHAPPGSRLTYVIDRRWR